MAGGVLVCLETVNVIITTEARLVYLLSYGLLYRLIRYGLLSHEPDAGTLLDLREASQ